MRLYVIGPVSGHEGDNREESPRQDRAGDAVGERHARLHTGDAVHVAGLPGVFGSKGARCERGVCAQLGIPLKTVAEWCGR